MSLDRAETPSVGKITNRLEGLQRVQSMKNGNKLDFLQDPHQIYNRVDSSTTTQTF